MRNLSQFIGEFSGGFQPSARHRAYFFLPPSLILDILKPNVNIDLSLQGLLGGNTGTDALEATTSLPMIMQWLLRGMLVSETRLPSRAFETVDLNMYGITETYPYHSEFNDLGCTFLQPLVAKDNGVPRFFNYWQNFIQRAHRGPDSGLDFRFPSDYYGNMLLVLYDRKNHPTIGYRIEKVYPKAVESVSVTWDNSDFLKSSVTFQFSYWTVIERLSPENIALEAAGLAGQ